MPALFLAAALGVLYLVAGPSTADLAAQTYRAGLFDRAGFLLWDNGWYGGHHLPGYSVLFPPLGAWVGVRLVGGLAVLAATAAFVCLVRDRPGGRGAAAWFALAMGATLISGRIPFALGIAFGGWAAAVAEGDRRAIAGALGVATALSSPVAALFLALAAAARRTPAWLAAGGAAGVVTGFLVLAFPEGGTEPFDGSSFWPALLATLLALPLVRSGPLRTAAALYAVLLAGAFAVPSPVGGNAARLGALLAGPLAVLVLWPGRRRLLAAAALPLAWWTLYPAVRDWIDAGGDPATHAAYFAPLVAELKARGAGAAPARIEIPFTAGHWEAAHVAASVPIARGWERQLDRRVNGVFYDGSLTPERYARWLDDHAIRWVALPDAALDPSAEAEAGLIRTRPPFLAEVWRSAHWRLYEVRGARPLGVTRLFADGFASNGGGDVRVRFTPYWKIVGGHGCVERAPGGWTRVRAAAPVTVRARFAVGRIVSHGPRCTP
jgi:hypothetical protein